MCIYVCLCVYIYTYTFIYAYMALVWYSEARFPSSSCWVSRFDFSFQAW